MAMSLMIQTTAAERSGRATQETENQTETQSTSTMTAAPMFRRITHDVEKSQLYPLADGSSHRHVYSKPEQELSAWPAADPTPLRHLDQRPERQSIP